MYAAIEDALDGVDGKRHPQLAALHTNHLSKLRRAAAFREDVCAAPPSPFAHTVHAHEAIETTHHGPWIAVSASCESSTLPPGGARVSSGHVSAVLRCRAQPITSTAVTRQLHLLTTVHLSRSSETPLSSPATVGRWSFSSLERRRRCRARRWRSTWHVSVRWLCRSLCWCCHTPRPCAHCSPPAQLTLRSFPLLSPRGDPFV